MRNVRKILVVCVLFSGSTVCQEPEIICPPGDYKPIRVTSPYMYPYSVLIVRVEPKPFRTHGLTGTIVAPLWVLTRATVIAAYMKEIKEWGIAGPNTNVVILEKTKIYPVESIHISPYHNTSKHRSSYNMLLLKLKWTDDNIIPVVIPGQYNIDSISEVNIVYWMDEDIYYRKYTTYFCPQLRAMRSKCRVYNRRPHLCLAGQPEGNERLPLSPCGPGAKTLGGGIFSKNVLIGIYLGVDNERGDHACDKPGVKFYHGALRVQLDYDPTIPEISRLISWVNGTQKNYFSTTTRRTTTRRRLKPSSLWQFCVGGAHISNPLLLLILGFALVVSALLV